MLPGQFRKSVVVAAALATVLAGVWAVFAEVRWPGTSISAAECRVCDFGREDESGLPSGESEGEDQDDEDEREIILAVGTSLFCQTDPPIAFLRLQERRAPGSRRPVTPLVRGPPAAS